MCTELLIIKRGRQTMASNCGDLASAIGMQWQDIPLEECCTKRHPSAARDCLCSVDLWKISSAYGFALMQQAWETKYQCDAVMDDMMPDDAPTKADEAYLAWKRGEVTNG